MGTDLRALLDDDDGKIRLELLEPGGGGKTGRTRADDHHVEFHRLPGGQLVRRHDFLPRKRMAPAAMRFFHVCAQAAMPGISRRGRMGDNREGMKPRIPSAADELLAFYVDSGVDVALGEAPVDRFADRAPDATASPTTGERVGRGTTASGPPWRVEGEGPSPRLPPKGAAGLPDRVAPAPAPPGGAVMAGGGGGGN